MMSSRVGVFITASLMALAGAAQAADFCVCDPFIPGCTNLQVALSAAMINGQDDRIMIEQGTYNGDFAYTGNDGDLTIEGGYTGSAGGGTPCSGGPAIDPGNTIIEGTSNGFVALGVTNDAGGAVDFLLRGVTVTGGNSPAGGAGLSVFGFMNVELDRSVFAGNETADPPLAETAGGAYIDPFVLQGAGNPTVTVTACEFRDNIGGAAGGLKIVSSGVADTTVNVTDSLFEDNASEPAPIGEAGGASVNLPGPVTFSGNFFGQGTAMTGNNGGNSGALSIVNRPVIPIFTPGPLDVVVSDNVIEDNAAGVATGPGAGGLYVEIPPDDGGGGSALIEGNVFARNGADVGGGLNVRDDDGSAPGVTVLSNTFQGNSASSGGGAEIYSVGRAVLVNNVVFGNVVTAGLLPSLGGGFNLRLDGDGFGNTGSAVVTNNTLSGENSAEDNGGGIYVAMLVDGTEIDIYNNLIYDNESFAGLDEFFIDNTGNSTGTAPVVRLFDNGFDFDTIDGWGAAVPFAPDASNIDLGGVNTANLYVDDANGDFHLLDGAVVAGPAVIDVGDNGAPELPLLDRDGEPRIANGIVDFGAYEFIVAEPDTDEDGVPDSSDNCFEVANGPDIPDAGGNVQLDTDADLIGNICDIDIALPNDCVGNFSDLVEFKNAFFSTPVAPNWNPDADFNGDLQVNFPDLAIARDNFFRNYILDNPSGIEPNGCTP